MQDIDNLRKMLDDKIIPYDVDYFTDKVQITIHRGFVGLYTVFLFDLEGNFMDMMALQ